MVTELKKAEELDLNSYDLEYAELLGAEWRQQVNEIEVKFRCPVRAWHLKEKRNRFFRYFGLGALIADPCTEYELEIVFLGVSDVIDTLISQAHTVTGLPPSDKTRLESVIFTLDDIRIIKQRDDVFRFYLRSEGLQLDFNFVDFIFRQLCVSK